MDRHLRIVYMGTPDFAVEPLRAILEAGYEVAAVVTSPDKPAGRGRHLQQSPVKQFALQHGLPVLQPVSLKAPEFIDELKSYNANLQVVVAFRMLPEVVWQMPEHGTLNLHASLLPQYRGAAPINHAIINGETETGVTTFFIEKEIDTGKIILAEKQPIFPDDNAGTLHDRLMMAGSRLVVRTLEQIAAGTVKETSQKLLVSGSSVLNPAPKIFRQDCQIRWTNSSLSIHNLVRGLSPYPGAYALLNSEGQPGRQVKIYRTTCVSAPAEGTPGNIVTDSKNFISVITGDGAINIEELQPEGKSRMQVSEFLRGYRLEGASFA